MVELAALPLGAVRDDAASFITALAGIYTLLILVAVLLSMYQQIGGRIPYSRPLRAAMDFVDSLTAPVLDFFRRFVPMLGPLDLSPLVAILVVGIGGQLLAQLIAG